MRFADTQRSGLLRTARHSVSCLRRKAAASRHTPRLDRDPLLPYSLAILAGFRQGIKRFNTVRRSSIEIDFVKTMAGHAVARHANEAKPNFINTSRRSVAVHAPPSEIAAATPAAMIRVVAVTIRRASASRWPGLKHLSASFIAMNM